jgi:hypothetical protein
LQAWLDEDAERALERDDAACVGDGQAGVRTDQATDEEIEETRRQDQTHLFQKSTNAGARPGDDEEHDQHREPVGERRRDVGDEVDPRPWRCRPHQHVHPLRPLGCHARPERGEHHPEQPVRPEGGDQIAAAGGAVLNVVLTRQPE